MVGAVIVFQNKIIGEGYTSSYGGNHAEVNAINSVQDKDLLKKATIYVSLEPCSHYGKTPPCANLIIKHQIPNVVIGCIDTFSKVSGKGVKLLEQHGCNVTVGILEAECKEINKRFFTYHEQNRPYIILKWAVTQDGFIGPENNNGITWISNNFSKQQVHKLRAEEQAILIGTNTAINDNPKLNCRSWQGKNPIRIVLDRKLRIPKENYIYNQQINTIIITEVEVENKDNLFFETINYNKSIVKQICDIAYKYEIQSIIVEGGSKTIQTFIDENIWDEAQVYTGNSYFQNGVKSPKFKGSLIYETKIKTDTFKIYSNDS